jgi:hypothetical protein
MRSLYKIKCNKQKSYIDSLFAFKGVKKSVCCFSKQDFYFDENKLYIELTNLINFITCNIDLPKQNFKYAYKSESSFRNKNSNKQSTSLVIKKSKSKSYYEIIV